MKLFTSKAEKVLWISAAIVQLTIYATIGVTRSLSGFLRENGLLTPVFISGMVLVAASVVALSLRRSTNIRTLGILLCIIAVYTMVLIRIEVPEERTHIIEYGLVAILIYRALLERKKSGSLILVVFAILITTALGFLDELIQWIVPDRVFDFEDVLFNGIAASMAVGSGWLLNKFSGRNKKT